jgi:oxygen-independent coproporphyrinogen-3 oxidase
VRDTSVGVYVHVPFCERVCPYCDFAVVAARSLGAAVQREYVDALLRELDARAPHFAELRLASLYLGGGTPSLLDPAELRRIVRAVHAHFDADREVECTLELNPGSVERARLPDFRAAGVNRLSVGIQSFDDGVLKRLGRAHRGAAGRAALRAARAAGFENVSIDLIYGAPGQSLAGLERDLDEAIAFAPEHVSAYELSVEEGTPFALAAARGQLSQPDELTAVRMFEGVGTALGAAGYVAYELSSHARPGFESVHNRRYWERRPVLGIGMGAWSCEPATERAPHGSRRANVRDLPIYLERIGADRSAAAAAPEVLCAATARGEAAFLALRTARGLDAVRFAREFGAPPRRFFGPEIDQLRAAGLLAEALGGDLRLTGRGRRLSDSVFERFV